MAIVFEESKTKENLMRAFAGESQARNRYTIAAQEAQKQGMYAVNQIFLFTADQERAHAKRFYELLRDLSGTSIHIDGSYPVDYFPDLTDMLRAAAHNEKEEFEDVYPSFAAVAKEEGFYEAASAFLQIAKIEEIHGKRFEVVAKCLENGVFYERKQSGVWMCLNCGNIHEGMKVPPVCPVCHYERGYFIPVELAPYLEIEYLK